MSVSDFSVFFPSLNSRSLPLNCKNRRFNKFDAFLENYGYDDYDDCYDYDNGKPITTIITLITVKYNYSCFQDV